jgi:hypothetical protein
VGETGFFQATYTVTSSDVAARNVTDSAVASGTRDVVNGKLVTSNTTSVTVSTQAPPPNVFPVSLLRASHQRSTPVLPPR